jgi:hypothetical protein
MRGWGVGAVVALAVIGSAGHGSAAVLCKKKSGVVVIRDDACRKKETAVALAEFGAVGPQGEVGPRGPSTGYVTRLDTEMNIPETSGVTLMSLDVPDGSYVVTARLHGITLTDPDGAPGNSYRYDCHLKAGDTVLDDLWPRVGTQPGVESYLVYIGGFSGSGPITFRCTAGNGHPLRAISGVMTAVAVDTLVDQSPE